MGVDGSTQLALAELCAADPAAWRGERESRTGDWLGPSQLPDPAAQWRPGWRAAERREVTLSVLVALASPGWADRVACRDRAGLRSDRLRRSAGVEVAAPAAPVASRYRR